MTTADELADRVQELVDAIDGIAAVYGRRLDVDAYLEVGRVDELFPTGSAAKAFVLLSYLEMVANARIDPSTRVTVDATYRDARGGSGVLRHLDAGLAPTLHDCATLMMIVSDNVATDLLLDAIGGPAAVNHTLSAHELSGVELSSPTVWTMPPAQFGMASPRGLANFWQTLATGDGQVAEAARAITWRHQHREGFGRFLPFAPDLPDFGLDSPLRLWSKSGSYPTVSCEAGLFETDRSRWVLAVMARDLTDWGNGSAAAGPTLRAEVARAVFEAWAGGSSTEATHADVP